MSKEFESYAGVLSEASGIDFLSQEGQGTMNPKEIDESIRGFEQEIEPTIPKQIKKHHRVTVNPVTGEPMVEREKTPKKPKGAKKKGETKQQKRQAKMSAFWDSIAS